MITSVSNCWGNKTEETYLSTIFFFITDTVGGKVFGILTSFDLFFCLDLLVLLLLDVLDSLTAEL